MKLLIIHNKYLRKNIGGEDIVYKNELEFLQTRLGKENVFSYEVSNDDISKIKLVFGIWFSLNFYNDIKDIIKVNNIDLVHVHNFYPLLTPSIFKASKESGAKVVHTLHNYRLWCISGIFYREGYGVCELCTKTKFSLSGIMNRCFRKSLIQSALAQMSFWFYEYMNVFDNIDFFFVLTEFQRKKIISLGIDKKRIILKPNSLDMQVNASLNKSGYVFVGRLEESKGILELLTTWKGLDQKFVLTVIGSGDIEDELKIKFNQVNIFFKGGCSRKDTLEIISKSKYLIQPSLLYETFGLTIIEAMSHGVPVIGFNIGTRSDFINDGVNGFLSNRSDLERVIERSYNYFDYQSLSKNSIETSKLYENHYITNKQINIYEDILKEKG
jgi:glycosyltransferase involved in cell wall biosynthesis